MSWGERSCVHYGHCPLGEGCTITRCTVACSMYESNGFPSDTSLNFNDVGLIERIRHAGNILAQGDNYSGGIKEYMLYGTAGNATKPVLTRNDKEKQCRPSAAKRKQLRKKRKKRK